eukprot:9503851-Pyramimonas_sp.AAC.3
MPACIGVAIECGKENEGSIECGTYVVKPDLVLVANVLLGHTVVTQGLHTVASSVQSKCSAGNVLQVSN